MNRSTFPTLVDTFLEHFDAQSSDMANINRFQELKLKSTLTASEQTELNSLTTTLKDKLFTAEDFNKLQDCITNLETFFRDNVEGYISTKQTDMQTYVNAKKTEVDNVVSGGETSINNTKDSAISAIEAEKANIITYMDSTTAGELRNDIGVMGDLKTTANTNLVGAINEVNGKIFTGSSAPVAPPANQIWVDTN